MSRSGAGSAIGTARKRTGIAWPGGWTPVRRSWQHRQLCTGDGAARRLDGGRAVSLAIGSVLPHGQSECVSVRGGRLVDLGLGTVAVSQVT